MPNINESPHSFISRKDWSFRHQGEKDQARHAQKVKDAIKDNLHKVISDGNIITADPNSKKIIKVPMRSLEIPHIKYKNGNSGVGSGDGSEQVGDVIGRRPAKKPGQGEQAGDQPGVEYYEAELTMEEIQAMVFADLGLPNLKPKSKDMLESEDVVYDVRRKLKRTAGIDPIQTILENMKRNAVETGKVQIRDILPEDYKNITYREIIKPQNSAVAIFKRDVSGSMGEMEKYLSRAFSWWAVSYLRSQYPNVETVFITHDTVATEVDEDQFFTRGTGGGTKCSSSLIKANEIIDTRYPPSQYNIYPFHFSDGDSYGMEDNKLCIAEVKKMLANDISQYTYVQVRKNDGPTSLGKAYRDGLQDERFAIVDINTKDDILPGLKKAFPVDKT